MKWDSRELSNDILSSVLVDGFIYGFDIQNSQANTIEPTIGEFKCLRLETGEVMWKADTGLFVLGFAVYFWCSGLFTAVRTGAM